MMSKKSKRTTTITLSLNVNNESEYRFTVDIGRRTITEEQTEELIGKNCFGEKFRLGGLGPALLGLLVQLGEATRPPDPDDWSDGGTSEPFDRPEFLDVLKYGVREGDASAEVSVPAADEVASDGQVVQIEPSHKSK
jgi:hypothetical protein